MSEESPADQYRRLMRESAPKRAKYGNRPTVANGTRYDSKAEYDYAGHLDMRHRAKEIAGYDYHVKFPLIAEGGTVIGYYESDFVVYLLNGEQEVHDVKSHGTRTALFSWKARHYKAQYGNNIIQIDSKTFQPLKP